MRGSLLSFNNNHNDDDEEDDDDDDDEDADEFVTGVLEEDSNSKDGSYDGYRSNSNFKEVHDDSDEANKRRNRVNVQNDRDVPRKNDHEAEAPRFAVSFRDIEESVRIFDGSEDLCVEAWVREFEETAEVMHWNEFQKFIFAKKLLKGVAHLFIMSERGITSWLKLKNALLQEFKTTYNSAQLHQKMIERRMKKEESVHEYYFAMKDLASRGCIEESALIQYIIDGIRDTNLNKTILYGANDLKSFKIKLKCYEIMCNKSRATANLKLPEKKTNVLAKSEDIKCFNCGEKGHLSANCKNKEKGKKCFNCNKFGHVAKECVLNKSANINCKYVSVVDSIMNKEITMGNYKCIALIDTGSKFNIITEHLLKNLNVCEIKPVNVQLVGVGENRNKNKINPIGKIKHDIIIDEEQFNVEFLVIPNKCIDVEAVLGQDFCQQAQIQIDHRGVHISKPDVTEV